MKRALVFFACLLFASFVNAATYLAPSAEYIPGTRDIGLPVGVLDTDVDVRATFTRESWPVCSEPEPGQTYCNVIEGAIYVSVNGGPQQMRCGFTAVGGNLIDRHGNPVNASSISCSLPPGILRTVTVTMTNKLTLRTAMTIETY